MLLDTEISRGASLQDGVAWINSCVSLSWIKNEDVIHKCLGYK